MSCELCSGIKSQNNIYKEFTKETYLQMKNVQFVCIFSPDELIRILNSRNVGKFSLNNKQRPIAD